MLRFRPMNRIRKRTFVVTGLTLLAVVFVGGIIALAAFALIGSENMIHFAVNESQSRTSVLGSGISFNRAKSSNLLADASFEPLVFRQALTVYSGDATTLTVSSEEASAGLYGDGFFNGAAARVMTETPSGLALKKNARVQQYGINRVGVFLPVNLPGDVPDGLAVLAFARQGDLALAVGEQGLIIRNVTGQSPEIIDPGLTADLTGICVSANGFLTCSDAGDLLFSAEGDTWEPWLPQSRTPLRAVAVSEKDIYVAVGDDGIIVTGKGGQGSVLNDQTTASLKDIAYGNSTFVAVGAKGTILVSRTGLLWRQILPAGSTDWQAIDFRDGRFVLAGSGGAIAISDDGLTFQKIRNQDKQDYVDIVMLSRQQLIVLDKDGGFAVSNDNGMSWLQSGIETGMKSKVIALASKDKVLSADGSGKIGLAQLVAEIRLDSPLKDGQYQAGDLIFLEKTAAGIPDNYLPVDPGNDAFQDPWDFFGQGTSLRTIEESSPDGGKACLLLQTMANQAAGASGAIISQAIDPELIFTDHQNEIYRIELWMKQNGLADRSVQVWLTGPFKPVGTTFTNVGATWKKYSYTFVMPAQSASLSSDEIRLNIAIDSGSLWLDQVCLSLAAESSDLLSSDLYAELDQIQPQVIRLGFLSIGGQSDRKESWAALLGNESPSINEAGWFSAAGNSMHAALNLVKDSKADPWLVIDSYTSEAELLNLVEYLAGPISEPYGKIRLAQGDTVPWSQQFNRILFEITDSYDIFRSDQQKADFVNLMIQTITDSPYYRQIKSQLTFIDGMTYSAGVVLSTADYHGSDLNGLISTDSSQAIQDAFLVYYDQIPRNPEKPIQSWSEIMRTAMLRPNGTTLPNLADLTEILLRDLGSQSALSNLAMPDTDSLAWKDSWTSAAAIASACARGVPLEIAGSDGEVFAYGFKSDSQIAIALINLSDEVAECQLTTDLPLDQAGLWKYDAEGKLLNQQTMKSRESRLTVLAGGVVLIVKDLAD